MTKRSKSLTFEAASLSRGAYEMQCIRHGYTALSDSDCIKLFLQFSGTRDDKKFETQLAFSRGYAVAGEDS